MSGAGGGNLSAGRAADSANRALGGDGASVARAEVVEESDGFPFQRHGRPARLSVCGTRHAVVLLRVSCVRRRHVLCLARACAHRHEDDGPPASLLGGDEARECAGVGLQRRRRRLRRKQRFRVVVRRQWACHPRRPLNL